MSSAKSSQYKKGAVQSRTTSGSHRPTSSPLSSPTSSKSKTTTAAIQRTTPVLFLDVCHTTFVPPNQRVSVFFDECNQEIISLTSVDQSKTKVVIQATHRTDIAEFLLPVEKRILSIKFNRSRTILAYHVEKNNIEFLNVHHSKTPAGQVVYTLDDKRYVQPARTKNSKLFGFLWPGPYELVMVTDISVEYYHVDSNRRRLRHEKSFQSSNNWFVYQPPVVVNANYSNAEGSGPTACDDDQHSILMTSTGSLGNSMQPYLFDRGQIFKLQRFDVEGDWLGGDKLEMFERSVTIGYIYGSTRLLVLQHESLNVKSKGAQILVYTVDYDSGMTNKTHTLDLDVSGRFALNILDNLVVAHDQPSRSSFIFDIMIKSTEKSDLPKHFVALLDSQPLRSMKLEAEDKDVELYSLNWVFFQPNYIIDAEKGLLFTLHLDLSAVVQNIQENIMLLSFLALRTNSEDAIMKKCKEVVMKAYEKASSGRNLSLGTPLTDVSSIFEILSKLIKPAQEVNKKQQSTVKRLSPLTGGVILDRDEKQVDKHKQYAASIMQDEFHLQVLNYLTTVEPKSLAELHFISSTLLEFIFVVRKQTKSVEFCIYEQLFNFLVSNKLYYQLIQMIRSEIFEDSKQLACRLLSLSSSYRPAAQLGLDMLDRIDCLTDLMKLLNLRSNPSVMHSETTNRLLMALDGTQEATS